jgi:hypothetical protein
MNVRRMTAEEIEAAGVWEDDPYVPDPEIAEILEETSRGTGRLRGPSLHDYRTDVRHSIIRKPQNTVGKEQRPRAGIKRGATAKDKQSRWRLRCREEGRCDHCGKPCAPYAACEDRRREKREKARLKYRAVHGLNMWYSYHHPRGRSTREAAAAAQAARGEG